MNNFQNGATSSQLSPQAFKNSNQNVNFQETYGVSGTQQTNNANQLLNSASPSGALTVVTGSSVQVLGVSTTANTSTESVQANGSISFVPFALLLLVVSAGLALFFFKQFKNTPIEVEEQQPEDEE